MNRRDGVAWSAGADARATAATVRDYHRPIKGELAADRGRYHALDPETYYWAHATFFEAQVAAELLTRTR